MFEAGAFEVEYMVPLVCSEVSRFEKGELPHGHMSFVEALSNAHVDPSEPA